MHELDEMQLCVGRCAPPDDSFRDGAIHSCKWIAPPEAFGLSSDLSFPPPPVGVGPAPVCMTLLVLTDQNAKADAGPTVALVAEFMVADHLGLNSVLGVRG
jgi:hypothetical protein